jgi:hypothetical protein
LTRLDVFFLAPDFYRRSILQMKGSRNLYFMHPGKGFAIGDFRPLPAQW